MRPASEVAAKLGRCWLAADYAATSLEYMAAISEPAAIIEADRAELVADVFAYLIAKAQEPVEIFTGSFAKPLHADERTAWLKKMQKEYNEGNA